MNLSPFSCLLLPSLKAYATPENKAKNNFPALQVCIVPLNKPAFCLVLNPWIPVMFRMSSSLKVGLK